MEKNPSRFIDPYKPILFIKTGLFLSNSVTFPKEFANELKLNYISKSGAKLIVKKMQKADGLQINVKSPRAKQEISNILADQAIGSLLNNSDTYINKFYNTVHSRSKIGSITTRASGLLVALDFFSTPLEHIKKNVVEWRKIKNDENFDRDINGLMNTIKSSENPTYNEPLDLIIPLDGSVPDEILIQEIEDTLEENGFNPN